MISYNDPDWIKLIRLKGQKDVLILDDNNIEEDLIDKINDNVPKLGLLDRLQKKDPKIYNNLSIIFFI